MKARLVGAGDAVRAIAPLVAGLGHELVATADDGEQLIELTATHGPDLVLLDIALGGPSDVVALTRILGEQHDVGVVCLSRQADDERLRHIGAAGALGCVALPCSPLQLSSAIDMALRLRARERRLSEQVAAANKELKTLSYTVGHDLQAPLRSVQGFAKALMEDHAASLDTSAVEQLQRIARAAQRMGELIDGLLRLSRVTSSPMRRGAVDLSALVRIAGLELQAAQPERSVELVIQPDIVVEGDEQLLRMVVEHLIGNAWKFTRHTAAAHIAFGCELREGERVFFVRDNGVGFDQRYASKLFNVFQRMHSVDEFEGIGAGLAIVKRAIDRHDGRVWAQAQADQGATFFFTLCANENGDSYHFQKR